MRWNGIARRMTWNGAQDEVEHETPTEERDMMAIVTDLGDTITTAHTGAAARAIVYYRVRRARRQARVILARLRARLRATVNH